VEVLLIVLELITVLIGSAPAMLGTKAIEATIAVELIRFMSFIGLSLVGSKVNR
jgi:hypothetical protein